MTRRRLTISISILALSGYLLYLLTAAQLPGTTVPLEHSQQLKPEHSATLQSEKNPSDGATAAGKISEDPATIPQASVNPRKRLEIYGRVVDEDQRPIENLLVLEQRYLFNTRTDTNGNYRLAIELPQHRYPVFHYLRGGFRGQRIELDQRDVDAQAKKEINLVLETAIDIVSVNGWVGTHNGIGLEAVRIEIAATDSQGVDSSFQTTFSDEHGNFSLEGIQAGAVYKLNLNPSSDYGAYQDDEFSVTQDPKQLEFRLETLKLIDIDGMIVSSSGAPVPNFEMYINGLPKNSHVEKILSDSSGFFRLMKFPVGEVNLSTGGPDYFKISGLKLLEKAYDSLVLVVDTGDYYVSGWASDENGIAVEKALVTLDASLERAGIEYSSYRSSGTDSGGSFRFDNIGSGEHRLAVYANGFARYEVVVRTELQTDQIHIILRRDN